VPQKIFIIEEMSALLYIQSVLELFSIEQVLSSQVYTPKLPRHKKNEKATGFWLERGTQ